MMITKYEQQTSITQEKILECKTAISAAEEITRIMTIRVKEIATLISRTTITNVEKTKLTSEETEIKEKLETQSNVIQTQTKNLSTYETTLTTLTTTITTFKKYITEITVVIKTLEKKVKETKTALKPLPKKDPDAAEEAKPEKEEKEEKDEDGDDKVDEDEVEDEKPEAVGGGNEKVDKELEQVEEETKTTTTQIESLTTTIIKTTEKVEKNDAVTVTEVTDTTKQDSALIEVRNRKKRLIRRRERQRCARLFPQVFSSFKIKKELTAENMCPCPGSGKGTTQLILDGVEDPSDFDKFVLALFEKNMALEGTFNAQMQRYFYNDGDKLVSEETNPVSLRLVVVDDKVDEVLNILDQQNQNLKSTDVKISPLLKGKQAYLKWQQSSLVSSKAPALHVELREDDEDDDEDIEE